ncbi:MAG: Transcriptional regulator, MarR family, partial [uncultured Pseudonocardia sp.]
DRAARAGPGDPRPGPAPGHRGPRRPAPRCRHHLPPAAGAAGDDGRQPVHAPAEAGGRRLRRDHQDPRAAHPGHLPRPDRPGAVGLRRVRRRPPRRAGRV